MSKPTRRRVRHAIGRNFLTVAMWAEAHPTRYCDFGRSDAGLAQARARVAARTIEAMDTRMLSTREAEKLTGVSHSEFSRIRNTQLRRFTLDRLIAILGKLDTGVEINLDFTSSRRAKAEAPA